MSLIQCHYDYVCCIWNKGLNKVLKNQLKTTQNKEIAGSKECSPNAYCLLKVELVIKRYLYTKR